MWPWKLQLTFMIWRPYDAPWSKRSLSRCGLLDHILCSLRLVRHYLEWVWVILGGWGWVGLGGEIFWVGGGGWKNVLSEWGWVEVTGVSGGGGGEWGWVHCLIIPFSFFYFWRSYYKDSIMTLEKYASREIFYL